MVTRIALNRSAPLGFQRILSGMWFSDHALLFARVPLLVWPWLAWQLWRLQRWSARTGRQLMLRVEPSGRVRVIAVGPDPAAPMAWTPACLSAHLTGEADHRIVCRAPFALPKSALMRHICFQLIALMRGPRSARYGLRARRLRPAFAGHSAGAQTPHSRGPPG